MSLFPLASLPLILLCHGGGYGDPGYPNIFNPLSRITHSFYQISAIGSPQADETVEQVVPAQRSPNACFNTNQCQSKD